MSNIQIILLFIFVFVVGFYIGFVTYEIFFGKPAHAFLNVVHDPDEDKPYLMLDLTNEELKKLDNREYIKLKIRHINMRE